MEHKGGSSVRRVDIAKADLSEAVQREALRSALTVIELAGMFGGG